LRFGDPKHPKTKSLVAGVVAGIGGTAIRRRADRRRRTIFTPAITACLVNAMTVGIAIRTKFSIPKAAGIGNPVVYVGSKTGRDGIKGATMASANQMPMRKQNAPRCKWATITEKWCWKPASM